ncbi:cation:proton antiporter [Marivirga sp. S37H4]|uniref:Cation:proton antiporter n=1 Tax=Marivirga aurantiaca TaxID=2802615 RepID=A0A934WW66_9BACT|nr:cation:proton antiporter [Marivirga aurantiaca]MBK6264077.1 cation:proton antiporter [Marivirga aurantiaca]
MEVLKLPEFFDDYSLWLLIIGVCIFIASFLPRILSSAPLGMPSLIFIIGYLIIKLPLGLEPPDIKEEGTIVEHITELAVIITLMAAGLKIDRPFSFKGWKVTWYLLTITMILTVALTFLAGWVIAAFVPATAMLLGAVIAPTDSLMASDVEVGAPKKGSKDEENGQEEMEDLEDIDDIEEDEVRFAVTTEAGFNDGLAFPFTNLALVMVLFGAHPENWWETWLVVDVLYKLIIGALMGLLLGYACAKALFSIEVKSELSKSIMGLTSVGITLIIYGITEHIGAYGFLAVFIAAVTIRQLEPTHVYHTYLYLFIEKIQRIFMVLILIGLGAAVANGLLAPLNVSLILLAVIIIAIIRPVAGILGLLNINEIPWRDKWGITFLIGIRGFGAIYYLSYALNRAPFPQADELYAVVALVIIISLFFHGALSSPIIDKLDKLRKYGKGNA